MNATLIGIPLDLGAENLGVDIGPEAFRHQQIDKKLASAGIELTDAGDVKIRPRKELDSGDPRSRYLDEIVRVSNESAAATESALKNQQKVIALGGDHSISLGTISGAAAVFGNDLGVIYLDAHGDMNTDETTLTGNIHGMGLAALLGHGNSELTHIHGEQPKIATQNLLHAGGSDFDKAEIEFIEREQIAHFNIFDFLSNGLAPLLKMIDEIKSRTTNQWISLDLDVIDIVYAPGAGMPNKRGLTYREIAAIAEYIGQNCNVVGVDIVEYNPLQDVGHKTAELGIELIAKFLGRDYSWYSNYLQQNKV